VVTIPGASATSRAATLTVTPDQTAPSLLSAEGNVSNGHVTLIFSEPIRLEDATNTANFTLSGGLTISNAVLLVDRKTVVLTTSPQSRRHQLYRQVSGIRDRSAAGNTTGAGKAPPSSAGWMRSSSDRSPVGPT
jgi:hypothetical protein